MPGGLVPRRTASCAAPGHTEGESKCSDACGDGAYLRSHVGMPITTWVDLIEAMATTPTSSPSSSTASRDISDTMRNGPACISTCAITVSLTTRVTMPRIRLRADSSFTAPTCAGLAISRARVARSLPLTVSRPALSLAVSRRPESAIRRTVSSDTPSSSAASEIRKCGINTTVLPQLRPEQEDAYVHTRHQRLSSRGNLDLAEHVRLRDPRDGEDPADPRGLSGPGYHHASGRQTTAGPAQLLRPHRHAAVEQRGAERRDRAGQLTDRGIVGGGRAGGFQRCAGAGRDLLQTCDEDLRRHPDDSRRRWADRGEAGPSHRTARPRGGLGPAPSGRQRGTGCAQGDAGARWQHLR